MSESAARNADRTLSQMSEKYRTVLGELERDEQRTVEDLIEATGLEKRTLQTVVGDLVSRGLVQRRPLPGDARRSLYWLTTDGAQVLQS